MVQLKAKGANQYQVANHPVNVGQAEAEVVLACLRQAVDSVVVLSASGDASETMLSMIVNLRQMLSKVAAEAEEMATMIKVIERRMMNL